MFRPPASGRTPLFRLLRRAARSLIEDETDKSPALHRYLHESSVSRRAFLQSLGIGSLVAATPALLAGCSRKRKPSTVPQLKNHNIVIVGAGMAGLNAARHLERAGIGTTLYDAAPRSGGRMYTARNLIGPGLTTELGGEFIDTIHVDMLELVRDLGLTLIDTHQDRSLGLTEGYFFGGSFRSEREVIHAFTPLAEKIRLDFDSTGEIVDFQHEGGGTQLDNLTISAYLDKIGASGWIRELLSVAYLTEFGLELDQQSALNLIFLIGTELPATHFQPFGESDERFKVLGGNERVVQAIAETLYSPVHLEHRLAAIRQHGTGYRLHFERQNGATLEVKADHVILTLPFSLLREVDTQQLGFSPLKQRAIAELSYGTNAKLFVGYTGRPWLAQKLTGNVLSDEGYQLMWDNTQGQAGTVGGLTLYSGGTAGIEVGNGSAESQIRKLLPGVEKTVPGTRTLLSGVFHRFHWPTQPFAKGSYSAYRPGQWTTIAGSEGLPEGNIHFAGEHCSYDFQGYMNGAAETGRKAATAILEKVSPATQPPRLMPK